MSAKSGVFGLDAAQRFAQALSDCGAGPLRRITSAKTHPSCKAIGRGQFTDECLTLDLETFGTLGVGC